MTTQHLVRLSEQEIYDLLATIEMARNDLCPAPGHVYAAELDRRWGALAQRLRAKLKEPAE